MNNEEIALTLTAHEHEIGSLKKRMTKAEEQQKTITDLMLNVQKLADSTESLAQEIKKQGERIEQLESEPAKNYQKYKSAIVTSVITTVTGMVVGAIFMLVLK